MLVREPEQNDNFEPFLGKKEQEQLDRLREYNEGKQYKQAFKLARYLEPNWPKLKKSYVFWREYGIASRAARNYNRERLTNIRINLFKLENTPALVKHDWICHDIFDSLEHNRLRKLPRLLSELNKYSQDFNNHNMAANAAKGGIAYLRGDFEEAYFSFGDAEIDWRHSLPSSFNTVWQKNNVIWMLKSKAKLHDPSMCHYFITEILGTKPSIFVRIKIRAIGASSNFGLRIGQTTKPRPI